MTSTGDKNTLGDMCGILRAVFVNAEISNTGGGCMAIVIPWGEDHVLVTEWATESPWQAGYYEPGRDAPVRWAEGTAHEIVRAIDDWTGE